LTDFGGTVWYPKTYVRSEGGFRGQNNTTQIGMAAQTLDCLSLLEAPSHLGNDIDFAIVLKLIVRGII